LVRVSYAPYKEIVLHEIIEQESQVLFEDMVKEGLEGRLHYASVMFTRVPFQSQVPVRIGNQNYSARLRKADNNPHLAAVAKFLTKFKGESPSD